MSAITDRRKELRTEARDRQRLTLPKLRARLRELKARRKKRLAACAADCRRRKAKVQTQARAAREKLKTRLVRLRERAQQACGQCRAPANDRTLAQLDRTLAAIAQEREVISELRRRASMLVDPRGRAGGRRAQEVRAESDEEVARNLADDPDLERLWARQKNRQRRFPRTKYHTRTEAFLDWVHQHPEALHELRHADAERWDREAAELEHAWAKAQPTGHLSDDQLARLTAELDQLDRWLLKTEVPDDLPF